MEASLILTFSWNCSPTVQGGATDRIIFSHFKTDDMYIAPKLEIFVVKQTVFRVEIVY